MDEHFQIQPFGTGGGNLLYLVDGQFAGQDDTVRAKLLRGQQRRGMRQIGERGKEQAALVSGLTGKGPARRDPE